MSPARRILFVLVALCVASVGVFGDSKVLSLVETEELSYFFGTRPATNVLCYTRNIRKGSISPITVSYSNGNAKNINFVTMNADRRSLFGYTVDLMEGQLGTTAISYKLHGPGVLPYAITVNMFCDP